jgi:uncharacterized membrane protein YphA (DoxX/SURF4 family)
MRGIYTTYKRFDKQITEWMACYGITLLRVSLGLVFFWFGVLKFFPGLSPAQDLAGRTIDILTFGVVPASVSVHVLALWECVIGVCLITNLFMRAALLLLFLQMMGTVTPIFIFPEEVFFAIPFAPTLEGQYIIKNIVLVSAGLIIGATVRGGRIVADPIDIFAPEIGRRGDGVPAEIKTINLRHAPNSPHLALIKQKGENKHLVQFW